MKPVWASKPDGSLFLAAVDGGFSWSPSQNVFLGHRRRRFGVAHRALTKYNTAMEKLSDKLVARPSEKAKAQPNTGIDSSLPGASAGAFSWTTRATGSCEGRVADPLQACRICPRACGVDRWAERGYCGAGALVKVARAALHHWEEPCLSGERGSGTVFFSYCNLRCVFCQNYRISQEGFGAELTSEELAEVFLHLQELGAHNLNLVTPTPYVPQIREALILAKHNGLTLPVVYNSNAYETVESLRSLEGLVDVYLPDLKYFSAALSIKYSHAPDYFALATLAITEMHRQVGNPLFDSSGMLLRGLMIRHLLVPGLYYDSQQVIRWVLTHLPREVHLNLLGQYIPLGRAAEYPEINRRLSRKRYEQLVEFALLHGWVSGYAQEHGSAAEAYVPEFNLDGLDFLLARREAPTTS